jgi:hypothetical protein
MRLELKTNFYCSTEDSRRRKQTQLVDQTAQLKQKGDEFQFGLFDQLFGSSKSQEKIVDT